MRQCGLKITLMVFVMTAFGANAAFAEKIAVAASANTYFALRKIAQLYERGYKDDEVVLTVGSSGKLSTQIKYGAPFDLFLSADMSYPEKLAQDGLTRGAPVVYARGILVVWSWAEGDISKPADFLSSDQVKKIAIANPKLSPYGAQSEQALKTMMSYDEVADKIVYGMDLSQVTQYLHSQIADTVITAKSVVLSKRVKGVGQWREISLKWYDPIEQGMVVVWHDHPPARLRAIDRFAGFLLGPAAQAIFKEFGYRFPKKALPQPAL